MLTCAVTDRVRFSGEHPGRQVALLDQATRLAAAGVNFVQLREKDLPAADLAELARELLATLRAHSPAPKLLINVRADIALAVAADGVHLTSAPGSLTPSQIRTLYASAGLPEPVVSISCHTLADVAHARAAAPSFILFGPVFEKVIAAPDSHSNETRIAEGSGLNLLHLACATAAPIPVLALGGITEENTSACLAAGAAGIAAIRMFLDL